MFSTEFVNTIQINYNCIIIMNACTSVYVYCFFWTGDLLGRKASWFVAVETKYVINFPIEVLIPLIFEKQWRRAKMRGSIIVWFHCGKVSFYTPCFQQVDVEWHGQGNKEFPVGSGSPDIRFSFTYRRKRVLNVRSQILMSESPMALGSFRNYPEFTSEL